MSDIIAVMASFVHGHIKNSVTPDATLEEKAEAALRVAADTSVTFMLTDDDARFRAGVGGLVLLVQDNPDELARVQHEVNVLGTVSRMLAAGRFDTDALEPFVRDDAPKAIHLMDIWRKVNGGK